MPPEVAQRRLDEPFRHRERPLVQRPPLPELRQLLPELQARRVPKEKVVEPALAQLHQRQRELLPHPPEHPKQVLHKVDEQLFATLEPAHQLPRQARCRLLA